MSTRRHTDFCFSITVDYYLHCAVIVVGSIKEIDKTLKMHYFIFSGGWYSILNNTFFSKIIIVSTSR